MPSLEAMHYFTILGVDNAEFNRYNPLTLSQGSFDNWSGFKLIIGSYYAQEYSLHVGDTITLELDNSPYTFTIAGISAAKGLFLRDMADGGFMLAPKSTLAQVYGPGSNLVFIKLNDKSQREAIKTRLAQDFSEFTVRYGVNDAVVAAETRNFVMPFQASSTVVIFMCLFIIYTAFNLITLERIPIVGTLRSIGCTRKKINTILIIESAGLGAAGGLLGCLLGVGMLQYIKLLYFTGDDAALNSTVLFGANEVLSAVGAAVTITVLSAILPILRLTRTPIKNVILNQRTQKTGRPSRLWLGGLALMTACLAAPRFLPNNLAGMIIASSLATGAVIGLIPLVPFLTRRLSNLAANLPFLSQDVVLGVRNVRDNPSLMNNIQLFAVAIAIVAFMASMFNTMGADLLKAWERDARWDVTLVLRHSTPQTLAQLARIEGVQAVSGYYVDYAPVVNQGTFLNALIGVDDPGFFDLQAMGEVENNQAALAALNDGKNIITTNVLKDQLRLKIGDTFLLQLGGKQVAYTVTGFVETNYSIGHVGIISSENFRQDLNVADYSSIMVKASGDPRQVKNNLLRALGKEVMRIETRQEGMTANADKVVSMFKAINSYCYLALLVGIIGIVNNLVASFIERKRSFAMYRCVGMSKKSLNRMLVTEALAMGVLGVVFGISCALVMSATIPVAVSAMWGKVTVQLAANEMSLISMAGILAMLVISAVPVVSSSKLSLIETIKYE
jgi:putative ABC transport system permease protein